MDQETAYTEFLATWPKIRRTPDLDPLEDAWQKAKAYPIQTKRHTPEIPTPRYNEFVAFAGYLQITVGDRPIMLPVREVGAKMGADKRLVSLWRQMAVDDGYLEVIRLHTFKPGGKGEATEFRFGAGYLEWFRAHMKRSAKK